jgi:hypothetical protein
MSDGGLMVFILVAFGATVGTLTMVAFKGKPGMFVLGVFIHPVWLFGAIRLAKPSSLWARYSYSSHQMNLANARYPRDRGLPVSRPPARPRELDIAFRLLLAAAAVMALRMSLATVLVGAFIPVVLLTWRGWRTGRVVLAVLGGVAAVAGVGVPWAISGEMGTAVYIVSMVGCVVGLLLTVAAVWLLYRPAVTGYFAQVRPAQYADLLADVPAGIVIIDPDSGIAGGR